MILQEVVSTRHTEMIDPILHVWGWEIPVYLFIGGLVAGLMIISGYDIIKTQGKKDAKGTIHSICPCVNIAILTLGMIALFLDLEHQLYVWRLYTTFEIASPMSWGAWILIGVYPVLALSLLLQLPQTFPHIADRFPVLRTISDFLHSKPWIVNNIGFFNMALGILLGVYTGILLSALGARPLWNSAALGILFLFSGLSSAAAFMHLITLNRPQHITFNDAVIASVMNLMKSTVKEPEEKHTIVTADNSFLSIEFGIIVLYFIGLMTSTEVHMEAGMLLLAGSYAASFWVFVMLIGIIIPLFLQSMEVAGKLQHTEIPPIFVLFGGLALRFIMVYAGQYSSW